MLEHALQVMRAWRFRYKSQLVWDKGRIGTGYWARNRHEIVLIGTRGRFPCGMPALFPTSIIPGKAREHSRKPEWLHEVIEARHPELPKVELFARTTRPGWVALGNQTDKFAGKSA
jgi:N6-adenosine-specific RNA methylase IME4